MKFLAFAASNSNNSINRMLVTFTIDLLNTEIVPKVEIDTIDMNDF